jgi:type VI secretion system protein ImpC
MSTTSLISGKFKFELNLGPSMQPVARDPDAPLHVLVMGDFLGSPAREAGKPIPVDCDNFDAVMRSLRPQCRVSISNGVTELSFSTLDYFHPDRILPQIARLLEAEADSPAPAADTDTDTSLIRRLMGGPAPVESPSKPVGGKVDISGILKAAVASSMTPTPGPGEQARHAASTLARTNALRSILHNSNFQALEANWRGLDLLVRGFGGEDNIRFSILNCVQEDFIADVSLQEDLQTAKLFKLLHHRDAHERVGLVLGLYDFEPTFAHMGVLARVAKICDTQKAVFLAAGKPSFAGCDSFAEEANCKELEPKFQAAWLKVRALPEASRVSLALPRFLLRQPYGSGGEPIDSFSFEELSPDVPHEDFLWGNPAVLCVHALAAAFLAEGWAVSLNGFGEVEDLPVHRFKQHGETKVKPCAEAWMPESVSERIFSQGLVPVMSIKGRDAVRVNLRPISSADAPLKLG